MYYTNSNTNPADFLTKIKPAASYLNNPLWEFGPDYMTSENWQDGRSIDEIRDQMTPSVEQNNEIQAEVKKKFKNTQINLTKTTQVDEKTNFVSLAQLKSNDLLKVQRAILLCIEYLVKTAPKRLLQTGREEKDDPPDEHENCCGGDNSRKFFWAMFNRKWYVVQKPDHEEIPKEIKVKRTNDATIVKFMCDQTYGAIPNNRIQPFGATEIDEKRGKRDPKGYKIATTAKHFTNEDRNNLQDEDGKLEKENVSPPGTNEPTNETTNSNGDEVTLTFQKIYETWSALQNESSEKINIIMKLMIENDQKLTFGDDYKRLEEGKDVEKTSELFD